MTAAIFIWKSAFVLLIVGLVTLISSEPAFAWGPGVHMEVGNFLLANLPLLAPHVAEILAAHANAFLYGSLSADIFIGKGVKAIPGHSHNWSVGFDLLDRADAPFLKAYSLGYLTHLAADIVAHNYYVPNMLSAKLTRGKFSHVYVEMQADQRIAWNAQHAIDLFRQPYHAADASLLETMDKEQRPFLLKKRVFQNTLTITDRKFWTGLLNSAERILPLEQDDALLARMLDLTLKVTLNLLKDPKNAIAPEFDPIGSDNLALVKRLQRAWSVKPASLAPDAFPVDARLTKLPAFPCQAMLSL